MKQLIKILFVAALTVSFGSCEMTYDPIVIQPDVTLNDSGLTRINTIKTYETDVYTVVMTRTEGLSKAADFDVSLDPEALDDYNELNGSNYTLMPSSLYSISVTEISFEAASKTASFQVTFKPSATLAQAGSTPAAEMMVVPFTCTPKSVVNSPANRLTSILHLSFEDAIVKVNASAQPDLLTFIKGVAVPRQMQLVCDLNFKDPQISKLSVTSTQAMVNEYNTANVTDHLLLPTSAFNVNAGVYEAEESTLTYDITIEASALDPDHTYLLPVKIVSTDYTVIQDNIYYVEVSIQAIKYTIVNTDRYVVATKLSYGVDIEVKLNGALVDAVPIEFAYDASLIGAYNTDKGKTYLALDASKIAITNTTMAGSTITATVKIAVDMTGIEFETGNEYVLPFRIDKTKLPEGAVMSGGEEVYVRLKRTLYGTWSNIEAGTNYVTGTTGWTSRNNMWAVTSYNANRLFGGDYIYCNKYWQWDHGFSWHVAWDEVYNSEPNKRVVYAVSSVVSGFTAEQQLANVMDYGSYFDMSEGKVWFNFQYYYNEGDKTSDTRQTIKCYLESPLTAAEF